MKRSISLPCRKTSISLEDAFWDGLREMAAKRKLQLDDLVASINSQRQDNNLSSAIRVTVLAYYQELAGSSPRKQSAELVSSVDRLHAPSP